MPCFSAQVSPGFFDTAEMTAPDPLPPFGRCPRCGRALPTGNPRRIWCSGPCRWWVAKRGGPLAAAELLEDFAAEWVAFIATPEAAANAADLRERASALRRIGGADAG
jgi:hypothetical protein